MSKPTFTVIIPTINRPETLFFTLRTVLNNQNYQDYSVIVSDNFSNDNTKEVVDSFKSNKVTYINPGKRLSMSRHWEFALSHVTTGFVTILGDDDGLIPNGLEKVAKILEKNEGIRAVGWRFGNFNWKGLNPYFMIPMGNYYRVVNSKSEVEKIFQENIYNTIQFPSLYGGFIDISLIRELKEKNGGTFFHSRIPDFFSGAMVAASLKEYIRIEFPITINATSKFSTGFATINKKNDQKAYNDLVKGDDNIPFHEKLVFIRSNAVPISEAMLQVSKLVSTFPSVDIKKIIRQVFIEAQSAAISEEHDDLKKGALEIAELNGLEGFALEIDRQTKHLPIPHIVKEKFSPVSLTLYIDSRKSGTDTVEDACLLVNKLLPSNFIKVSDRISLLYIRLSVSIRFLYLKFFSKASNFL